MTRIFITGASGFVGSYVLDDLLKKGHDVLALFRSPPAAEMGEIAYKTIEGDYAEPERFSNALAGFEPDVVLHLAWTGVANKDHSSLAQFDNMMASRRLMEVAAAAGARHWIALGSQAEYGPHKSIITETTATLPTTTYGAAKLATYLLTRSVAEALGLRFAWIRLFSCFGPGDEGDWLIPYLAKTYAAGETPSLTPGDQLWDYLHVQDVSSAIVAVAEAPDAAGVFNLGSGSPVSIATVAKLMRDRLAPSLDTGLGRKPYAPNQVMHMEADIGRLTEATGWRPEIDFEAGIAQTADWYLERTKQRH